MGIGCIDSKSRRTIELFFDRTIRGTNTVGQLTVKLIQYRPAYEVYVVYLRGPR